MNRTLLKIEYLKDLREYYRHYERRSVQELFFFVALMGTTIIATLTLITRSIIQEITLLVLFFATIGYSATLIMFMFSYQKKADKYDSKIQDLYKELLKRK